MSEQSAPTRICPTCGSAIPAMARYCPSCGTRLDPAAAYSADDFEDVLADVLDAPEDEPPVEPVPPSVSPDEVTVTLPPVTARTPGAQSEWTASASDWSQPAGQPGTWNATTPPTPTAKPRINRTMWIILAIFGFIVFCCCAAFFVLLLVAENDTAFQEEITRMATIWIG